MNIDKNLLETLAGLDDALRAAMRGATDADIARAKDILKGYRKES